MPVSEEPTREMCGKWMPRAKTTCGRKPLHPGKCVTAEALANHADRRPRKTKRRRGKRAADDPAVRSCWNRAYRWSRYGITQKQYDWLLELQEHACAMCHEPFVEDSVICVDHDHACCPVEKRSCGKCIRGLLCMSCNTALGHIQRKLHLAQTYLTAQPGRMALSVLTAV
jgi:hypothetical protein